MQREISMRSITTCHFVPSILTLFVAPSEDSILSECSTLEYVVCSGEALASKDCKVLTEAIPHVQIWNYYGPTEASIDVSSHLYKKDSDVYSVSLGGPVANTQLHILDEHLNCVPIGVTGELFIGGIQLARGYYNRPELTASRFIPDPFSNGGRIYATSDLCSFTPVTGDINYFGRADFQVKIRGFRIELGEIEIKTASHPGVKDVVATAHTTDLGSKQLVVYFTPAPTHATDTTLTASLHKHLVSILPAYMVPSHLILLEKFPLLPNGKLNRKMLPKPNKAVNARKTTSWSEPRNDTERILAAVWKSVLKVDTPIGILDNFFELGGDSILSIQVASKLRAQGLSVEVKHLFAYQTIAELSMHVVQRKETHLEEQGLLEGETQLSPIQQWFFDLGLAQENHFNQAQILSVPQGLKEEELRLITQILLTHHDALRIRVEEGNRAIVFGDVPELLPCEFIDLSALAAEEKVAVRKSVTDKAQASLDLHNGPVVRLVLFHDNAQQEDDLLVVVHHVAIDGVSWRVIISDVEVLSKHLLEKHLASKNLLPPKTSSIKTWTKCLSEFQTTHVKDFEKEDAYWSKVVDAVTTHVPSLGVTLDKSMDTLNSVNSVETSITVEETKALLTSVCSLYHAQVNDVLLTAFTLALLEWRGNDDEHSAVAFSLEGHGREDLFNGVDVSRTVGWFTSLFPVYIDLGDTPRDSLKEVIKKVKEQVHSVPNHGVGFGILNYLTSGDNKQRYNFPKVAEEISFNYLGQFSGKDALFSSEKYLGDSSSPLNHLYRVLDINGMVTDSKLTFTFAYPSRHFNVEKVQSLADKFAGALRRIVRHCSEDPTAGGFTPSDFPLVDLSQPQLDAVVAKYGPPNVLEILPLSPMQSGMLYHTLLDPHNQEYITQVKWTIQSNQRTLLTPENLKSSWEAIIERHGIFRTGFYFTGQNIPPVQIMLSNTGTVQLPWSELHVQNDSELAEILRKDREQGFDLSAAPLMRCTYITIEQRPVCTRIQKKKTK